MVTFVTRDDNVMATATSLAEFINKQVSDIYDEIQRIHFKLYTDDTEWKFKKDFYNVQYMADNGILSAEYFLSYFACETICLHFHIGLWEINALLDGFKKQNMQELPSPEEFFDNCLKEATMETITSGGFDVNDVAKYMTIFMRDGQAVTGTLHIASCFDKFPYPEKTILKAIDAVQLHNTKEYFYVNFEKLEDQSYMDRYYVTREGVHAIASELKLNPDKYSRNEIDIITRRYDQEFDALMTGILKQRREKREPDKIPVGTPRVCVKYNKAVTTSVNVEQCVYYLSPRHVGIQAVDALKNLYSADFIKENFIQLPDIGTTDYAITQDGLMAMATLKILADQVDPDVFDRVVDTQMLYSYAKEFQKVEENGDWSGRRISKNKNAYTVDSGQIDSNVKVSKKNVDGKVDIHITIN